MSDEYITKAQAIEVAESLRNIAGDSITDAFIKVIDGMKGCEAKPHWIYVEDRMPKHGEEVLCKTKWFQEVLQWDEISRVWCGLTRCYSQSYVTHWMPLPEPPKEE